MKTKEEYLAKMNEMMDKGKFATEVIQWTYDQIPARPQRPNKPQFIPKTSADAKILMEGLEAYEILNLGWKQASMGFGEVYNCLVGLVEIFG